MIFPFLISTLVFFGMTSCKTSDDIEESPNRNDNTKYSSEVSDCGGFQRSLNLTQSDVSTNYCSAETLLWTFNKANQELILTNNRILLNCCGNRKVEVSEEEDLFVIKEIDTPSGSKGRCKCSCVYDFRTTLKEINEEPLSIRIVRMISDIENREKTIFEGKIDLRLGKGMFTIEKNDIGPRCNNN